MLKFFNNFIVSSLIFIAGLHHPSMSMAREGKIPLYERLNVSRLLSGREPVVTPGQLTPRFGYENVERPRGKRSFLLDGKPKNHVLAGNRVLITPYFLEYPLESKGGNRFPPVNTSSFNHSRNKRELKDYHSFNQLTMNKAGPSKITNANKFFILNKIKGQSWFNEDQQQKISKKNAYLNRSNHNEKHNKSHALINESPDLFNNLIKKLSSQSKNHTINENSSKSDLATSSYGKNPKKSKGKAFKGRIDLSFRNSAVKKNPRSTTPERLELKGIVPPRVENYNFNPKRAGPIIQTPDKKRKMLDIRVPSAKSVHSYNGSESERE